MAAVARTPGAGAIRFAVAFVAVAAWFAVFAPGARAHATLVRSFPPDAVALKSPPAVLRLWFSEALSPSVSVVRLTDAQGDLVPGLTLDTSDARSGTLAIAVPRLPRGAYSLEWRVLSEDDVHFSKGGIAFGVGTDATPAAVRRAAATVEGTDVVFRWLSFLFLAGLVGGLAVAALVLGPLARSTRSVLVNVAAARARARALGWAAFCAVNAAVVGIAVLLWQTSSLTTESARAENVAWALLSESRWGMLWIAREAILLALLVSLFALLRGERVDAPARPRGSLALPAAGLLALVLVGVQAFSGHAAAVTPNGAVTVAVAGLHLLAAEVWIGGLLALVVALWPLFGPRRADSAGLARACLAPFSLLAAACVGLLAVTGLYYAGRQVASLDALLTTLYGRALLIKISLVLAVGAIGLLNTLILRPHLADPIARLLRRPAGWTPLPPTRLRSLLLAEAAFGISILAAVGLLTAAPPARGPEFAPAPEAAPAFRSGTVEDLVVSLSVKPNRPGPNVFELRAVSTRRPAPAPIERVRLRFTSSEKNVVSPQLEEIDPGRYRLGGDYLSDAGPWRIEALVERAGLDESRAAFDWAVSQSVAPKQVLVSNRPLEPVLTKASAAVLVGLAAAFGWLLITRLRGGALADALVVRTLKEKPK